MAKRKLAAVDAARLRQMERMAERVAWYHRAHPFVRVDHVWPYVVPPTLTWQAQSIRGWQPSLLRLIEQHSFGDV